MEIDIISMWFLVNLSFLLWLLEKAYITSCRHFSGQSLPAINVNSPFPFDGSTSSLFTLQHSFSQTTEKISANWKAKKPGFTNQQKARTFRTRNSEQYRKHFPASKSYIRFLWKQYSALQCEWEKFQKINETKSALYSSTIYFQSFPSRLRVLQYFIEVFQFLKCIHYIKIMII